MAIAERRMRAEIEAIPDGVYTFEDAIEDDGITDRDYPIKLLLTIDGGEVIADFTGLGGAGRRPRERDLRRHRLGDLQRLPPPHRPDDPAQRGLLPAVHDHRAARDDRELLVPGARRRRQHRDEPADHRHGLRRAAGRDPRRGSPPRAAARRRRSSSAASTRAPDEPYAHFHFEGVGWGGRKGLDGNNMVVTINGNCRNTPVEVFETRYPAFRIESYRLVADSGGPGEFRGGLGGERDLHRDRARGDRERAAEPDEDGAVGRARRRRRRRRRALGAPARAGGVADVRRGVRDDVAVEVLRASRFATGDQVKILMPGGGGYGDPAAPRPGARAARRRGGLRQRGGRTYGLRPRRRGWLTWASGRRPRSRYLKANRDACDLCGHPIAVRYWGAEVDGVPKMFCSPEHERLYHDYWLPRYGAKEVS